MKNVSKLLPAFVVILLLMACDDRWNDHYNNATTPITNDQLNISELSSYDYLNTREDLKSMFQFLEEQQVFSLLEQKNQLHTLMVVKNDAFVQPEEEDAQTMAFSHVTDIAMSPSHLYDGERILMWHEKFVKVSMDSLAIAGELSHIQLNGSPIQEVVKTKDGYIYILSEMIATPTSLYDFIQELPEEYSMFKAMVQESGGKVFDKANSKPIGVDATGNTLYDSVFIYTNEFFDKKSFNLSSESLTATMLVFSDEVIGKALEQARATLDSWNMERDEEVIKKWILEVAFYNKIFEAEAFATDQDLKSIYNRQWRTSEQVVDVNNPIPLSNGIAYYVQSLRIPNNILMYRLKDWFYYYEYCTDEQKAEYFQYENLKDLKCNTDVDYWTPEEGVWPKIRDRVLQAKCEDATSYFSLEFTPIKYTLDGAFGSVSPWLVPPGPYRLAMGFKQGLNLDLTITVYALVNGSKKEVAKGTINVGSSTTYHYDRGAEISDGYPEGYSKEEIDRLTATGTTNGKKAKNYDTDGGMVIEELEIPDLNEGKAMPLVIRIEAEKGSSSAITFCHWCLRPTSNNY